MIPIEPGSKFSGLFVIVIQNNKKGICEIPTVFLWNLSGLLFSYTFTFCSFRVKIVPYLVKIRQFGPVFEFF